ncbi:MAG: copper chaperone PCu(A)C [Burkholderiales bacterium]|nr:copper chaperone PCu(A)C [Burkholderiales bacterium]
MKSFTTAFSTVIAIAGLAWAGGAFAAEADVTVTRAWVRATMPGQPVAGAYLDLEAKRALKLTGVASPVATRGEVHEMKHEDGVMKMRQVAAVDLPAGRKVQLAPGGAARHAVRSAQAAGSRAVDTADAAIQRRGRQDIRTHADRAGEADRRR